MAHRFILTALFLGIVAITFTKQTFLRADVVFTKAEQMNDDLSLHVKTCPAVQCAFPVIPKGCSYEKSFYPNGCRTCGKVVC